MTTGVCSKASILYYVFILMIFQLNRALLFADDTKIYTNINCSHPSSTLQEDIDMHVKWSSM